MLPDNRFNQLPVADTPLVHFCLFKTATNGFLDSIDRPYRPDRQSTTQIHPDIEVNDPPQFGYGETVNVGPDEESALEWPAYVVADITHGKEMPDPDQPGRKALVFQVFLAKEEEWSLFEMPDYVRRVM